MWSVKEIYERKGLIQLPGPHVCLGLLVPSNWPRSLSGSRLERSRFAADPGAWAVRGTQVLISSLLQRRKFLWPVYAKSS